MTTTQATTPVSITHSALQAFLQLLQREDKRDVLGLRVGVKGGGCSGLSYVLGFDEKKEEDLEFQVEGLRVFMHPTHELYLAGMEIDYHDGLDNRGFVFNNPNASETCGCGSSFA